MEAARSAGVKRLVHLSANGAMNDPRLHYAHSKWLGEEAVRGCGIPFVILRPSLLFGPGDEFFSMVAAVVRAMPLVPIPGNGRARFQPIAMENAARCAVAALHDDRLLGQTIAIGGPEQMTMDQLYRLIAGVLRVRRLYAHVPVGLLRPAAAVLERLTPFAPVTPEQLVYATRDNIVELDAVQRHFGFTPKPMQGNLDYLQKITWRSAAKAMLGLGAPPTA
jgi:NADH dehydrogenase